MRRVFGAAAAVLAAMVLLPLGVSEAHADWPTGSYTVSGTAEFPTPPSPAPSMPPCEYPNCHAPSGTVNLTTLAGTLVGDYAEQVGPDGGFWIPNVPDGRYLLSVTLYLPGMDTYATDWYYGDTPYRTAATVIEVTDHDITDLHLNVPRGGSISGRLTDTAGAIPAQAIALAYLEDPSSGFQTVSTVTAPVSGSGAYTLDGLAPGRWVVQFAQNSERQASRYGVSFAGGGSLAEAEVFDVTDGAAISGADGTLGLYTVDVVDRIAGADRFDVAVDASGAAFEPGVEQVYVANGLNWPDALSAGPAAAQSDSPLLLVTPASVPSAVAEEIRRLRPGRIVVVGGENSVGAAVVKQLDAIAPVTRIGGADRYEVSRNINAFGFGSTIDSRSMLIATGRTFADALSAGATAAAWRQPVLLVDGLAPQLDSPTRQYIFGSLVDGVAAVGGPASISDDILDELGYFSKYDTPASRIGGADRFAVNRNLNAYDGYFAYPTLVDTAYLVSGLTFPDALSATTLAAHENARVFLAAPDCVPAETLDTIRGLHIEHLVLVGGPNTLGGGVAALAACTRNR